MKPTATITISGVRRFALILLLAEILSMLKVLIAEDQLLIADVLEETLIAAGYEVCGIARTVDEGVALGELHKPDLAILDVCLAKGDRGPDIARKLGSRGKFGVLYATGYDTKHSTLTLADGDACLQKPYQPEDVSRSLAIVWEMVTSGISTRPFPSGFRLLSESLNELPESLNEVNEVAA